MPYDPLLRQNRKGSTKALPGGPPTGPATGDVSGNYPGPLTVASINGNPLGTTTPSAGRLLVGSGTAWVSVAVSGDATLAASGALSLAATAVTAGSYGDSTHFTTFTVDAKGRLTAAAAVAVPTSSGRLLDASRNTDTVAHTPVRGDLILSNSTPAWTALAIGAAGTYIRSDGTDPSYQTIGALDIPDLVVRNVAWGQFSTPGTVTFTRTGCTGTQSATTGATETFETEGVYWNFPTGSALNTDMGIEVSSAADTRLQNRFDITISIRTGAASTDVQNVRIFSGLASITNLNAATGANNMAAFRLDTTIDGHWYSFTRNNSGSSTAKDTGVSAVADTVYKLRIVATSSTHIDFYINGTLVTSHDSGSDNLPAVATSLNFITQGYNLSGGTARNIKIRRFFLLQD